MSLGTGISLILGKGEVGRALFDCLHPKYLTFILDKNEDLSIQCSVLHICYPYSERFIEITKEYLEKYKPVVAVIHSTVPVGTTETLIESYDKTGNHIFHSPVRGKHPHLMSGLQTFAKEIGGNDENFGKELEKYFIDAGIPAHWTGLPAKNTEFAKIMCTSRYGWEIVWMRGIKEECDKLGLDFDLVYTKFNQDYNDGYTKLGEPHFHRSILKYMPGVIGGHCVLNNLKLHKNRFTDFIEEENKNYEQKSSRTVEETKTSAIR